MKHWRATLLVVGLALALGLPNYDILRKQRVVDNGTPVLLELRPLDPRSLLQGDYMSLSYDPKAFPPAEARESLPRRGTVIIKLEDGVARFARLDDGAPLGEGELRLRYKRRAYGDDLSYGSDSFFFQEGLAETYAEARFGVLRVDADGAGILVDLADENHNMLKRR